MYTAFSPGTKNLFLVLSAACCIVAFFLMDAMRKEQKRRKWVCGILLCILVAIAVAGFHEAKQSAVGRDSHGFFMLKGIVGDSAKDGFFAMYTLFGRKRGDFLRIS